MSTDKSVALSARRLGGEVRAFQDGVLPIFLLDFQQGVAQVFLFGDFIGIVEEAIGLPFSFHDIGKRYRDRLDLGVMRHFASIGFHRPWQEKRS